MSSSLLYILPGSVRTTWRATLAWTWRPESWKEGLVAHKLTLNVQTRRDQHIV